MRGPSRLFQGYLPFNSSTKPSMPEPVITTPITSNFTPGQTFALLKMRGSDLSLAVHAKLAKGTARATLEDFMDLATLGYALRQGNGYHKLTPRGHFTANALARTLAKQLGIPIPTFTPARRGGFERGVFSQNGNW